MRKSAHYLRTVVEGISGYDPYRKSKLGRAPASEEEKDAMESPISVDLITKIDVHRAIENLYAAGSLSDDEIKLLSYVMMDGQLSSRKISEALKVLEGITIDRRTISRRLNEAYYKIAKYLGPEYSDARILKMVAKRMGYPGPGYLLPNDVLEKVLTKWERT